MAEKNENQKEELVFLGRDAILTQDDLITKKVEIPEWRGFVYIRSMNAAERDEFEIDMVGEKDENSSSVNMENFRARLVARVVVNEKGKRLFTVKDIPALGEKNASAISRLYDAACEVNGIGKKDVEEITKNS